MIPNRGEEAEEEARMSMELWAPCHCDVIMAIQVQGEKAVQVQGEKAVKVQGEKKAVKVQGEKKAVQLQGEKVVQVQGEKVVQLYVSEVDSKKQHCYL